MPTALLKSKLYLPPVRPGMVPRQRLIERMQAAWNCRLTLISAPAGFGKTCLLSEWASICGRSVAWISLDPSDNDLERFLAYLIAALQSIQPGAGAAARAILEDAHFGPSRMPVESLLMSLVNDLAEISGDVALVLDDYHAITEMPVHAAIRFILENLPPPMHLLVSSRADPPWPLARLRVHGQVNELRVNDLRFTPPEAAAFLNDRMQLHLPEDQVAVLEDRTEGWIAGLQLAALSLQGQPDAREFIAAFAGSHHFISDFLVEEVLSHQPQEVRDFLLRTSVLNALCPALCDALTDGSGSRVLLARLDAANLFLVALDDERRWFRYHHLFRDLLLTNLENQYPGEALALHRKASLWYAAAGLDEDAIDHAFRSKDLELAAALIEQAAGRLDIENKLMHVVRWIDALPEELARARPWLCIYRAWGCYWMGQRDQVESWLGAAEVILQGSALADLDHIKGHIAAIRSHYALTNQDIPGVLANSRLALELLPEGDDMRTETATALGGAYWGLGDVHAAESAFAMARSNAIKGRHPTLAVPGTCYMAMQIAKQGRLKEAMAAYQDALFLATSPGGRETPASGFPNIKIGDLLREWNDLEAAGPYLERGLEQCHQLGQADVLADGYVALARWQMAGGRLEMAGENLAKAVQLTRRTSIDPFIQCWLEDCRLRLWLVQGDLAAAAEWAANWGASCGLQPDGPLSYHFDLNHLNLARWLFVQGRLEGARPLLARLLAAASQAGWVQDEIKILLLQAQVEDVSGRDSGSGKDSGDGGRGAGREPAAAALEQALRLAEPGGYIRLFLDEGQPIQRLLNGLRQKSPPPDPRLIPYLTRLLASFPVPMPQPAESALVEGASVKNQQHLHSLVSAARAGALQVQVSEIHNQQSSIPEPLTSRELEVLRLLATSLTSTEIAEKLYVAPSTVRTHIKSLYGKLDANRRMEAVEKARDLGLI